MYTQPVTNSISVKCHYLLNTTNIEQQPVGRIHNLLIEANITDRFDVTCSLVNYLRYFLRFVSAYVIIAFTLQRTFAIYSPFFQAKFSSKTIAWYIVWSLVILGLVLNIWVPFLFKLNEESFNYCDIQKKHSNTYFVITILYITLIMLIPIIVIFVCNTLIIYYVLKASKARLGMTMNMQRTTSTSRPSPTPSSISKV